MNSEEFKTWSKHHIARFSSVAKRLADQDAAEAWYLALKEVPLEDAKQISDDMFSGTEDAPRFLDQHPRTVREIFNKRRFGESNTSTDHPEKPRERWIDGVQVFTCDSCEDSGMLTVWHPYTMKHVEEVLNSVDEDAEFNRATIRTCTTACSCRWGQVSNKMRRVQLMEFDKGRMLPYTGKFAEKIQELFDFVDATPVEWSPDGP